jgi:hypothetical protein
MVYRQQTPATQLSHGASGRNSGAEAPQSDVIFEVVVEETVTVELRLFWCDSLTAQRSDQCRNPHSAIEITFIDLHALGLERKPPWATSSALQEAGAAFTRTSIRAMGALVPSDCDLQTLVIEQRHRPTDGARAGRRGIDRIRGFPAVSAERPPQRSATCRPVRQACGWRNRSRAELPAPITIALKKPCANRDGHRVSALPGVSVRVRLPMAEALPVMAPELKAIRAIWSF